MNRRLKIMHLLYSLDTGGMENGVVNLCNRLDPDRFEPSVCVLHGGGVLENRLDRRRVGLVEIKRHFGNDPTVPLRLAWQLRRRHIDILHTHNWVTLVEGFTAAKMARTPTIIHGEHGYPLEQRPRNVRVQSWLWPRARQITSVAGPLADGMAQLVGYPREQIHVIPNGVDTERFRPLDTPREQLRLEFGLPPQGLLLGVVARLDPVKNHAGMFEALAELGRSGLDVQLVLAGEGPIRDQLEQRSRELQIDDRVHFLGNVPEVERLFCALDVFVLNSHLEGMSNTLLEAMACGLPVVATAVGANPDLVVDGETGCLVPPDDPATLGRTLARLAADPAQRAAMGENGRRRIEQHFSVQRMVDDYNDLYARFDGAPRRPVEAATTP